VTISKTPLPTPLNGLAFGGFSPYWTSKAALLYRLSRLIFGDEQPHFGPEIIVAFVWVNEKEKFR